jgi:tight adherence protein B
MTPLAGMAAALGLAGALAVWAVGLRLAAGEGIRARLGPSGRPAVRSPSVVARLASARGWPGSAGSYGATVVASGLTLGLFGSRLAGPVGALAGMAGGPLAVEAWLARRRSASAALADEQLREAALAMASAVRAGMSVRQAVDEAATEMDPPLGPRLGEAVRRAAMGESLTASLATLRDIAPDAGLLISLLDVHRRAGGELPGLLEEVAAIISQRVEARRRIRALTAQGRASGAVLAVLPVAFVTLLSGSAGGGLGAFYRTGTGAALLAAGLLCQVLGFLWIRRIVRP